MVNINLSEDEVKALIQILEQTPVKLNAAPFLLALRNKLTSGSDLEKVKRGKNEKDAYNG